MTAPSQRLRPSSAWLRWRLQGVIHDLLELGIFGGIFLMSTHLLISLCCETPKRQIRVGWINCRPNGDISFGLCDEAYIAPRFEAAIGLWNAYNRVKTVFEVVSDPSSADHVANPHLTWHAPHYFHFKSNKQLAKDASFWGIADIPLMLSQESEVKWIRARTSRLGSLKTAGSLRGRFASRDFTQMVPSEDFSAEIEIDFTLPSAGQGFAHRSRWFVPWHQIGLRITMGFTFPGFPTLSWAHFH